MAYIKRTELNEPSIYILLALIGEPLSGYDIMKKVLEITEGRLEIKTGILYPTISALNNLGYILQVDEQTVGRNKKIYEITEQGRRALSKEVERLETRLSEMRTVLIGGIRDDEK